MHWVRIFTDEGRELQLFSLPTWMSIVMDWIMSVMYTSRPFELFGYF